MVVIDGRTWLEHLNPTDCWDRLRATPVGRIGVLNDSAPEIYPVNHVVDGDTIIFRTDPGSKLRGLLRSPAVCYEVDGFDEANATGWSVLVKGHAVELRDTDDVRAAKALPLRYWALGDKAHWIRIVPEAVTGRRIWTRDEGAAPARAPRACRRYVAAKRDEEVAHGPASDGS